MKLSVKVIANAAQTQVVGFVGDSLKIKVAVPPEKGKANRAIMRLLADTFDLPLSQIKLVSGSARANKIIELDGLESQALERFR